MRDHRKFVADLVRQYKAKSVAEIGVWQGRLSDVLMRLDLDRLILVDPFDTALPHCSKKWFSQAELDLVYEAILNRIPKHCEFYRLESVLAAGIMKDESLDFVFIDANHYKCAEDIEAWWPKVKQGGVLAGDDYVQIHEVKAAVDVAFPECESHGRIWWKEKK
jgi:predicted O-methyltransferase YrrM